MTEQPLSGDEMDELYELLVDDALARGLSEFVARDMATVRLHGGDVIGEDNIPMPPPVGAQELRKDLARLRTARTKSGPVGPA
jgi:hypothetical protein